MSYHWVMLADASRARILSSDEMLDGFDPVEDIVHPASRQRTSELMSDDRGRSQSGPGGAGTAFDAHTEAAQVEHQKFASELADRLLEGVNDRSFERLIIAAPPRFLGLLRDELSPRVSALVVKEINHDYVNVPTHQLGDLLRGQLEG